MQQPPLGDRDVRRRNPRTSLRESEDEERLPGVPIDLTIIGEKGKSGDALTLVTYQISWGTARTERWALARVKYFVEDGNLFRSEGPVEVEEVPYFQWQPPPPPPDEGDEEEAPVEPETPPNTVAGYLKDAPRELVARHVKAFDLRYGYWNDEGWFETSTWVAHEREYRNPMLELDPLDPAYEAMMRFLQSRPPDGIPAYVTVTLALGYGPDHARTQVFRTRIRLFRSEETYEPFIDPSLGADLLQAGATRRETPFVRR
jgi:hypothetical protein